MRGKTSAVPEDAQYIRYKVSRQADATEFEIEVLSFFDSQQAAEASISGQDIRHAYLATVADFLAIKSAHKSAQASLFADCPKPDETISVEPWWCAGRRLPYLRLTRRTGGCSNVLDVLLEPASSDCHLCPMKRLWDGHYGPDSCRPARAFAEMRERFDKSTSRRWRNNHDAHIDDRTNVYSFEDELSTSYGILTIEDEPTSTFDPSASSSREPLPTAAVPYFMHEFAVRSASEDPFSVSIGSVVDRSKSNLTPGHHRWTSRPYCLPTRPGDRMA